MVIDAYKLSYTVQFGTLIGSAPEVPSMIHNLAVGDGAEAAREVLAGVFPPDFNSYGLQWGVMCREMVNRADPARVAAAGKHPDFPAAVTAMPAMFPFAFTDCAQWDVPSAPAPVTTAVASDVPVLLTSGAFDAPRHPATPPKPPRPCRTPHSSCFPGSDTARRAGHRHALPRSWRASSTISTTPSTTAASRPSPCPHSISPDGT